MNVRNFVGCAKIGDSDTFFIDGEHAYDVPRSFDKVSACDCMQVCACATLGGNMPDDRDGE